ncbi:hypothetical protein GIB67_023904 [Kingdonia uniflora]|uniref:Homeobox domain-containing protein n=1 Tax=Kingdonia uniflora TaxID=39325 RepID=A0A7J7NGP0_9MAGN|nr:hypothetical protein GIB67_023904 [Kingdonia uniflora]
MESCEVHHEVEKILPEKNNKRKLKTPEQIEALENLYNEHMYPNEIIKAKLAEEIGLSEKQVSGWFCHRRLKDKNMLKAGVFANGRQDLSSDIVQDRGSVLKQDSSSSSKHKDYRHFDPWEVESRRIYGHEYQASDLIYKGEHMRTRKYSAMNNTSSGSSSASQERLFPHREREVTYDMKPLTYLSRGNYPLLNSSRKGIQNGGYKMESGYFHSQDEIEIAAISAVKRQLGRHYQEDGPPLGVRFHSLPTGAFDIPIREFTNERYHVGDPFIQNSRKVPRVIKERSFGKAIVIEGTLIKKRVRLRELKESRW